MSLQKEQKILPPGSKVLIKHFDARRQNYVAWRHSFGTINSISRRATENHKGRILSTRWTVYILENKVM